MFERRIYTCIALFLVGALTVGVLTGCGGDRGPERAVVSGTVSYNGKPVPEGMVRFMPGADSQAPIAGATITDGKYHVDMHGGVPVGSPRVSIEAYRWDKSQPSRFSDVGARIQYIPKHFNVDTQLTIEIEPGSRAITKNFDLSD
jgi:hypothetical protein